MKLQQFRWTIAQAAKELCLDPDTLSKRLTARGEVPGTDGRFSTKQVADAAYLGADLKAEQARLVAAQASIAEITLAEKQGELLTVDSAFNYFDGIMTPILRVIDLSAMTNEEKDRIHDQAQLLDRKTLINAITAKHKERAEAAGQTDVSTAGEAGTPAAEPMGE